jgi:hypothetical protein
MGLRSELTGLRTSKAELTSVECLHDQYAAIATRLDNTSSGFESLRDSLDNVGKKLMLKIDIKDACKLLDDKANVEEVNQAITAL